MNRQRYRTIFAWVFVAAAGAALCGCQPESEPKPEFPHEFLLDNDSVQEVPVAHIVRRDYYLREGDSLEIIYHVRHWRNPAYLIKIEDVIVIRFPFHPDLDQTEQVQSDGKVYLDLVGSVDVLDKTIDEVHKTLVARYAEYIKNPVLTVSFKQSNVRIEELKRAITTSPRGQSRLVPITPDGTIALPFIVDIRAAGLTIAQLQHNLNEAYKRIGLDELEVTVNVQNVIPLQVYVFGEVRIPGTLLNRTGRVSATGEITLLQAVAQSGSYIPGRADLSNVMLIRRRHLRVRQVAVINLHQLLENRTKAKDQPVVADASKYRYDIWLEDGDIVYVPTAEIAKRADYIEYVWTRGIRAVGGFTSSAGYTAGDAVDWLGPNP